MIPIVCVDDQNGMMFNGRRQSRDQALRRDVLAGLGGGRLWMNEYSAKQFAQETGARIMVDQDFLTKAGEGELCFVEDAPLALYLPKIRRLIVYRWNRRYPADAHLDLELASWKKVETTEFPGHSHEKITKDVYEP